MQTVLIVAGALSGRGLCALVSRRLALRLFRGRYVDGRYQVVATARLKGRGALVLVVTATPGAGAGEYQIIVDARVATGRCLRRGGGVG